MSNVHQPPNSAEAEEALIGSVIMDPEILRKLDIEKSDFYQTRNQEIWQAFLELDQIDYTTVTERLKAKGKLQAMSDQEYLAKTITFVGSSYHAEEYANIIREKAKRRNLLKFANEIAKTAYNEKKDIEALTPQYIQQLADINRVKFGAEHIKGTLNALLDEIEEKSRNPKDSWGIPTGFEAFDRVTGGIQKGELMLMSGEPGVGKSIFAMQLASQLARSEPGAIYSLEMGSAQVARRLVSGQAKISTRTLKTGKLENDDWSNVVKGISDLSSLDIYISDSVGWTTTSLRADLARLKAQHGVSWFVLDYLYLLNDGQGLDEIARTQMATTGLKRIVKEIDLGGVAIHSMNKSGIGQSGPPENNQLRGSGQVIYDADLAVYLKKYEPSGIESYPVEDHDKMRTLWFGKGRELEDPRKYIHYMKTDYYPTFQEVE